MFVITICPRCKKDFMYHNSDYHLWKPVAWRDQAQKEPCSYEVICQDCHHQETTQQEAVEKKTQQGD